MGGHTPGNNGWLNRIDAIALQKIGDNIHYFITYFNRTQPHFPDLNQEEVRNTIRLFILQVPTSVNSSQLTQGRKTNLLLGVLL